MNKFFYGVKAMVAVCLALAVAVPGNFAVMVNATGEGANIINPEPVSVDGVTLSKTAKAVDGVANTWDVTMKIEASEYKTTSDTVLVVDTSGSMKNGGRMNAAKEAAKNLANQLLPEGNTTNRIAIVSFDDTVKVSNFGSGRAFTGVYSAVENRINNLKYQYDGGTFTQAGIHEAAKLLEASTADIRSIVMLSDGVPTYNYAIINPNDYLVEGGPGEILEADGYEMQTSTEVPEDAFRYEGNRKGQGSRMWGRYESVKVGTGIGVLGYPYDIREFRYYNSANCAIAEAGFYKNKVIGDLYTVSLESEELGDEVLEQIASPGRAYTSDVSSLNAIFSQVAGSIKIQVQSASVNYEMAQGISMVDGTSYSKSSSGILNWAPDLEYDADVHKYVAEMTYRVQADSDIVENVDENGYATVNASSVLTYNDGKIMNFPELKVKPTIVSITEELVGQECEGCKFNVDLTYPDGEKKRATIKQGETVTMVEQWMNGEYTVSEPSEANSTMRFFRNFLVGYSQENFTIDGNSGGEIDIIISNIYETRDVIITKYWDDSEDKDGLRGEYNLFAYVMDGDRYAGYQKLTGEETYETVVIAGLPKYRDGEEIEYSIGEGTRCITEKTISFCKKFEGDDKYIVKIDGDVITNKHITEIEKTEEEEGFGDENKVVVSLSLTNEPGKGFVAKAPETGEINRTKTVDGFASASIAMIAVTVFGLVFTMGTIILSKREY